MKSYIYRDSRLEKLTEAIASLTEEQVDLRTILEAEQKALQTDDWTVTDDTFKAVAVDWLWQNFIFIKPLTDQDPVLRALATTSLLTPTQALGITAISNPHPTNPPADYLNQVLGAVDNDENVLTEIVHAAHQVWSKDGVENLIYPFDDVAVMLPVRVETLFDAPGSRNNEGADSWKLSIRVIPDEASICRDNSFVGDDEIKALTAFWQSVKQPGAVNEIWLDGEVANIAWKQLSTRLRPERAAWLISNLSIQILGDDITIDLPAGMSERALPNRVGGMPPELKIFAQTSIAIDGADHHFIGRLPKDEDKKIDNSLLKLDLLSKDADPKKSWLLSWDKVKEVGLGDEFSLPIGINPENIEAIYVIGVGEETPDAHFATQIDAGELSVPRLGDATNSVQGKETGSPIDWLKVAKTRLSKTLNPLPVLQASGDNIQLHITGSKNSLPFFPGADAEDDTLLSQQLTKALWPALWGNWMHDIWGLGDGAFRRGMWAFENFCPEGPLMPIRISDQPYGLLPVTSLELWETPMAVDPELAAQSREEMALVKFLNAITNQWANAALAKGNVVGKTSAQFMEAIGQTALNSRYMERNFQSIANIMAPQGLSVATKAEFKDRSLSAYKPAISAIGQEPKEVYLATGFSKFIRPTLPLVQSTYTLYRHRNGRERLPLSLLELVTSLLAFRPENSMEDYELEKFFHQFHTFPNPEGEYQFGSLPDSLLIRLLVNSCQTSYEWNRNDPGNLLQKKAISAVLREILRLSKKIDQDDWRQKAAGSSGQQLFKSIIPKDILKQLERAFCATLDSAANRIDPWITGFAWQRLKVHSNSSRHNHRLGVYGWVDGPFIGQPGPTESGLLHTPSYSQTLAALIMRDKFLSSTRTAATNERGQNIWQMNITSQKIRLAEEIADEVRMGFDINEVLGRQVENIVADPIEVRKLRSDTNYAMRDSKDEHEVCDGSKALARLLSEDHPEIEISPTQAAALQLLKDAIDTYGDLLMSDGILQLVNRQMDRAAETMEAASGNSRPPSLDFIRTPPSGYQLESIVLSALPFVSVDSLPGEVNPIRLADPSVAAFLENKLGVNWTWTAVNEDDNNIVGSVTLPTLGFSPVDALALSDELLSELVRYTLKLPIVSITKAGNRQWEAFDVDGNSFGTLTIASLNLNPDAMPEPDELATLIQAKLGIAADKTVRETVPEDMELWVAKDENGKVLGLADKSNLGEIPVKEDDLKKAVRQFLGLPKVRIEAPREHQLAQQLIASLGSRPASGRDLNENKLSPAVIDTRIYGEMAGRYTRIYEACGQLIKKLTEAGDDASRLGSLKEALPWGIAPISDPADREGLISAFFGITPSEFATPLSRIVDNVIMALQKRLTDTFHPNVLTDATKIDVPIDDHKDLKEKNIPDGVPSLARAIANLASPNAKLAILACWEKTGIVANTRLATGQAENIEEEWLTVTAAVRSNLARLEALQLEMVEPLVSWTNSPNDPWQAGDTSIIKKNIETRDTDSVVKMEMPRFVAAYGPASTWESENVAVGLIDAFSEAIPMPQRKTTTAFGFNAPAARAQQAILLAVPPKPRQRLDVDVLLKILEETRTLAHARTTRMEDLGNLQTLAPTMWLKNSGPTRVRLEPGPLFTN